MEEQGKPEEEGYKTSAQRSYNMSKIRSKNTKPELFLRKTLWSLGVRYRLHAKKLPGRPDIVIKKYKLAIFVDGEFWHGYNWDQRKADLKNNREFWINKIERNRKRDRENNTLLHNQGYKVFRFWDFEIEKNIGMCLKAILDYIDFKKHHSFVGE